MSARTTRTKPPTKPRRKTPAPESAQREWLRRVEAEYRSAAITQHLTLWLIQIGASPDLIHAGLRIVKDELAHAELSHRAFVAGGGGGAPRLARESLELPRHASEPLELDVARVCVDVFCLGETVAVRLFKELRERCREPAARRVLDRVLVDEVRHRDFGWALFAWLLDSPAQEAVRATITRELPSYFTRIRGLYAPANAKAVTLGDHELAWGLMPVSEYARVLANTLDKDYVPRFARLGIDARAAWNRPNLPPALARGAPFR